MIQNANSNLISLYDVAVCSFGECANRGSEWNSGHNCGAGDDIECYRAKCCGDVKYSDNNPKHFGDAEHSTYSEYPDSNSKCDALPGKS